MNGTLTTVVLYHPPCADNKSNVLGVGHMNGTLTTIEDPIPFEVFVGDRILSLNLFAAIAIGIPGNVLGIYYFYYITRTRDLPSLLYLTICVTDVVTCIAHFPVLFSLLTNRDPGLFSIMSLCIAWRVLFRGLQLLSVFLVMILSVTRALVIMRPFTILRRRTATGLILGYLGFLGVQNAVFRWAQDHLYTVWDGYCYEDVRPGMEIYGKIDDILYELEIGVPTILITVSFVFSVYSLKLSPTLISVTSSSGSSNSKHSASVTIVIVTAVFLLTNMPHVINLTLWNVDANNFKEGIGFYGTIFMYYYTFNISAVQMVVFNATISPIIYFFRITGFRDWAMGRMTSGIYSTRTSRVTEVFPVGNGSKPGSRSASVANGCGKSIVGYNKPIVQSRLVSVV
eukprot:sb/3465409/